MDIRLAKKTEYEAVRAFYHSLIDAMQDAQYKPGWEKEVYPSNDYLEESIFRGELYVGCEDGAIVSAMILNHACNESYDQVQWLTQAERHEVMIIHALGVHPDYAGRGLAKALLEYAIAAGEDAKQKALRLDVLKGNVPAEKLYLRCGFEYVDTIRMYYEDTGWTNFKLYEFKLNV